MCAEFKWKLFVWIIWSGDELLELQRAPFRCKFVEKLSFWWLSLENKPYNHIQKIVLPIYKTETTWQPLKSNYT